MSKFKQSDERIKRTVMVKVTKQEAEELKKRINGVSIIVCNRHAPSRARTYYVEESNVVLSVLQKINRKNVTDHFE